MYRHYSPQHRFSKQAEMDYSKILSPFASEGANKALYTAGGGLLGAGAGALLSKLMGRSALKGGLIGGGLGAGAGYLGRSVMLDKLLADAAKNAPAADIVTDSARMNPLPATSGPFAGEDDGSYDRVEAMRANRMTPALEADLQSQLGEKIRAGFEAKQNKGQTPESRAAEAAEAERVSQLAEEAGVKQRADRAAALADPNSPQSKHLAASAAVRAARERLREQEADIANTLALANRTNNKAVVDAYTKRMAELQNELRSLESVGNFVRTGEKGLFDSSTSSATQKLLGLTDDELKALIEFAQKR
jgi:hypothetical protein